MPVAGVDLDANGVDKQAQVLASLFFARYRDLIPHCRFRNQLSRLYLDTFNSWAPEEAVNDIYLQRPFKQVLFALARGLNVLRVGGSGDKYGKILFYPDLRRRERRLQAHRRGDSRRDSRHRGDSRRDSRHRGDSRHDDRRPSPALPRLGKAYNVWSEMGSEMDGWLKENGWLMSTELGFDKQQERLRSYGLELNGLHMRGTSDGSPHPVMLPSRRLITPDCRSINATDVEDFAVGSSSASASDRPLAGAGGAVVRQEGYRYPADDCGHQTSSAH
jgi:hypothetical protein